MINTNWALNKDFCPSEFPDHTDAEYYAFTAEQDYIDATIIAYLKYQGKGMTKANFTLTYRKTYNKELSEYAKSGK